MAVDNLSFPSRVQVAVAVAMAKPMGVSVCGRHGSPLLAALVRSEGTQSKANSEACETKCS